MSNFVNGRLYFIKDEFFDSVGDGYLKMNKESTKHDHIQIIKVSGIEQAFLFQDMFPIMEKYIENPYIKQNAFMEIRDPKKVAAIEKNAREIIKLIRLGIKFTPTQPDSIRIEKIMIEELKKENGDVNQDAAE